MDETMRDTFGLDQGRSDELTKLEVRLAALEGLLPNAARLEGNRGTGEFGMQGETAATAYTPTLADLDRLQERLREARSGEARAHRFARLARRSILARHAEVGRQVLDLEQAAAAARADVVNLSASAWKAFEAEAAADQACRQALQRFYDLLPHEQELLEPSRDPRQMLSFGAVRRWGRRARTYALLVFRLKAAMVELREAQLHYQSARDLRREGERTALVAEPRASELASAAAVLRLELIAVEEILSTLPTDPLGDDAPANDDYGRWVDLYDTITESDRRSIRARLQRLDYQPLISVVMPVYEPPLEFLREALNSVRAQLYTNWELCIADDASPNPAVRDLLRSFAEVEPRIKVVERASNGHISAASNSAMTLATGEFIALLDHDDLLPEHALFEVVACLNECRTLDIIYSDEDHIDEHGSRNSPYFKTDYNPDLILGHNQISHFGIYRRSLVEKIGGFRLGLEGSQDYDLALRAIDATSGDRIRHIPAILYHWRSATGEATFSQSMQQRCIVSARQALSDHLARTGQAGEVVPHPDLPLWQRIKRARPSPAPLVSVIIPTKDKADILAPCVRGVLERTDYPNIEVIIVDHESTEPSALGLLAWLSEDPRVRILHYTGSFNYSAINNIAVAKARGTVLALLNNDIEVMEPDWLDEMVSLAMLPSVGAVGAKLLYPGNRVQHAGVVLGMGGVAGHLGYLLDASDPGYFGRAVMVSTVSAVTAACLVVRKSVFDAAGGFNEDNLPVAFNDIDLCLKIGQRGYRNIFTPHALLYHHESISRGSDQVGERLERFNREVEFMLQKWGYLLEIDPYYNVNLNLATGDFSLAFPPRRHKPWIVRDSVI